MSFDSRAFRTALGTFATGVTVITTRPPDGEALGITVNSFASVSLDPPLVLFSLDRASHSFGAFAAASHYVVNVLADDQQDLSRRFSKTGQHGVEGVEAEIGAGGCPRLAGALAQLECAIEARHDGGDQVIYLGRVLAFHMRDDGQPLLYFRSRYADVAPVVPTVV
jgi:flavin reductase (DIM6/NTAB) family NADH-FMN oxidoreductase RutF